MPASLAQRRGRRTRFFRGDSREGRLGVKEERGGGDHPPPASGGLLLPRLRRRRLRGRRLRSGGGSRRGGRGPLESQGNELPAVGSVSRRPAARFADQAGFHAARFDVRAGDEFRGAHPGGGPLGQVNRHFPFGAHTAQQHLMRGNGPGFQSGRNRENPNRRTAVRNEKRGIPFGHAARFTLPMQGADFDRLNSGRLETTEGGNRRCPVNRKAFWRITKAKGRSRVPDSNHGEPARPATVLRCQLHLISRQGLFPGASFAAVTVPARPRVP